MPPFPLGIGTIDDVFHSSGISIDMLKRVVTLAAIDVAVDLSILAEMLSGALDESSESSIASTSSSVHRKLVGCTNHPET